MEELSLGQHATTLQRSKLVEKKNILHRKVISWQEVQQVYIPAISTIRRPSNPSDDAPDIQSLTLLLPSSLGQKIPWDKQLGEYEWLLRQAQAKDALSGLQQNLRLRDFLIKKKKNWARGVRENTRSQTVISQAQNKINVCVTRYRVARNAIGQLATSLQKGSAWSSEFPLLSDNDIQGLPTEGWGEGRRRLSWIWLTSGVENNTTPQLNDGTAIIELIELCLTSYNTLALRIQWCRARARAMRWSEEISLLQEEMRRVLAYLSWYETWWKGRAALAESCKSLPLQEGQRAYALHQAQIRSSMHEHFSQLWHDVPVWISTGQVEEDVEAQTK